MFRYSGQRPRVVIAALVALLALVLTACAFGPPDEKETQAQPPKLPKPTPSERPPTDEGIGVQTLVTGLEIPWGMAFLPDRTALVTERDSRRLLKVTPGGEVSEVQVIDEAKPRGEGGLMGVAVSPNYATDKTVFLYYTAQNDNRIARLVLGEEPIPIVTGIPSNNNHNGGQLVFGPDGNLYAGTGDAQSPDSAQDLSSLGGKILRMTPEGKPAPGNPFPDSLVYSYGHRNVQGISWDGQQRMYATEFGQDTWDEVNAITSGGNYGWPDVEGQAGVQGRVDPIVVWRPDEASPSGLVGVDKVLVAAALRGERLWVIGLTEDGKVDGEPQPLLHNEFGRLRAVVLAPDGSLWLATSNRDGRGSPTNDDDRIIRLVPPGGSAVELL